MNRIEVCAILKSSIEAGMPREEWDANLVVASGLLDKYGGECKGPCPTASAPASAPRAAAAPVGGSHTITAVGLEDHGNRMRVTMDGVPGTKYATAWDTDAAVFRQGGQGAKYEVTLVEKPNPKGGRPFVNLKDVRLAAATHAAATAAAEDIPF